MKKSIQFGVAFLALAIVFTACTNSGNNKAANDENSVQTSGITTVSEGLPQIPWIASKNTTRINTDDPIQAAVLISQTLWMATSEDNRPGSVILTSLDNWQNAVLSADLIHHPSNGPI
ncbi:hypothetical protein MKZ15_11970 [Paenibacillus sp. FSL R7-0216]|uniref:hypothetical protein n=1 Tax=Paenibacillus sp. FSL R7-0216 TaxID=2921677 RepID=UPI0030DB02F9